MEGFEEATYGERIAARYDELYPTGPGIESAADLLAELARGGPVLELGIGTGRMALPLVARGLEVYGIDASPAMVEQLRAKPGGDRVSITMGDFADVGVEDAPDGGFSLVFAAFNTLFALRTQDDQARCFANAAGVLAPGGAFLVEAFVPDVGRFRNEQSTVARKVEVDRVELDVSQHDPVEQTVTSQHVTLRADSVELWPVVLRYAWPAELDLMARLAGLRLWQRWAGWHRWPFNRTSTSHVSVWRKPS